MMFIAVESVTTYHGLLLIPCAIIITIFYYTALAIYNIYFHPLSSFPGPRLAAATPWWTALSYLNGRTPYDLLELHNTYGPVVRTSPDSLSYIKAPQWKEIYGHKAPGQLEFSKDSKYHSALKGDAVIINADREYHSYIRRLFAHGFSEKAMREQEEVLKGFVDVLFAKLGEVGEGGRPVDVVEWYNFLTFDFIGFLTFGESFDCLTTSTLHTWVQIFFALAKFMSFHQAISRLPKLLQLPATLLTMPKTISKDVKTLNELQSEKVQHRLKTEATVPDFMERLISAYNAGKMSYKQLEGNSQILIAAGSETTATLLAGLTYLLTQNPRVLAKLTSEVRSTFSHPDEITFTGVNSCKYLLACIEEALRVYPPSPQPHHRIVPAGGATVDGVFLPEGTAVSIPIYAASHSPLNWTLPEEFIPERWMTTKDDGNKDGAADEDVDVRLFAGDQHDASQPFQVGPRKCIGRNLAYAEIKIIMARLLWQFDIENATEGDWIGTQKVFMVWEKAPLWVKLHPVQRD
ncbi:averantin oxidoreductase [Colletotrichum lupini]|uniref:Averantin oxidoreductase n=1 Tax=Colletotrichum lupini TaxID=145971 RepID=A0A9Q8T5Q4_9PEZI|nr:averantin oxidoreductase [Colletotrichum lupini]KAK1705819.1 averantin oxidoreductase [Colletotrichum lupini]UQC88616.1 averantin oxidoreductase [Colletotrichum lupini]